MTTADDCSALIQQANGLFRQGNYSAAIQRFQQVLQLQPHLASAHYNLGLALQRHGQLEEAIASYQRALQLQPDLLIALNNLGAALKTLGRFDAAVSCYRQILQIQPGVAEVHANLGNALAMQGKLDESRTAFQETLRLNPKHSEAHHKLGMLAHEQGMLDEAISHYQQVLAVQPDHAAVLNKLGSAFQSQGKLDEALWHWRQVVRFQPDCADAHNNLATALLDQGNVEESAVHGLEALRLQPDSPLAHNNCGNTLLSLGKLEEAAVHFRHALRLDPDFHEAHNNMGMTLQSQGKLDEAATSYEQALRLQLDFVKARWNRSLLWLLRGDFERGWRDYEWRHSHPSFTPRSFAQPVWDGSDLDGRSILLYGEQGFGDVLHFIRYAPMVRQRCGKVIVECHAPLLRLLANVPGVDELVAMGAPLPAFDVQAGLLSLPRILGTSLANIPSEVPYLEANAVLVDHWHRQLAPLQSFKVGIAWQGRPTYGADRQRSIPLAFFARLAQVHGVQLISLQRGTGTEQLQALRGVFPVLDLGSSLDEASGAFMDTAAIMKNIDLVISSDTSVPHLAGALGVPVWVALALVPEWRWLLQRDDSPWYPTMRPIPSIAVLPVGRRFRPNGTSIERFGVKIKDP